MSIDAALQAFMHEYEKRTNGHDAEPVAELITEDATYWFNDGSFVGHEAIKGALRKTWATIQDETYTIENPQWKTTQRQGSRDKRSEKSRRSMESRA